MHDPPTSREEKKRLMALVILRNPEICPRQAMSISIQWRGQNVRVTKDRVASCTYIT